MCKLVVLVAAVSVAVGLSAVAETSPVGSRPRANPDRSNPAPSIGISDRPVGKRQSTRSPEGPKPNGSVSEPRLNPIVKPPTPKKVDANPSNPPAASKVNLKPPQSSVPKVCPVPPQPSEPTETDPMPRESPVSPTPPPSEDLEKEFFST